MRIIADLHTHTLVSHHAFSTAQEMCRGARDAGLAAIGITDHGPALPDGAHPWHFGNIATLPRHLEDVFIIRGMEANILDTRGSLDTTDFNPAALDFIIASFHDPCFPPASVNEHTEAWLAVLQNPLVDAMGHPGNENFRFEYETVIKECARYGKLMELNEHSLSVRRGSTVNCRELALLCKKFGAQVIVSTDAHISCEVGKFPRILAMLEEISFPEELVLNANQERLSDYFMKRKNFQID